MRRKEAKKLWDKVFPFKVGDRVRIVKVYNFPKKSYSTTEEIVGAIGTIIRINEGEFFPILIRFDQDWNSYPFKENELEKIAS